MRGRRALGLALLWACAGCAVMSGAGPDPGALINARSDPRPAPARRLAFVAVEVELSEGGVQTVGSQVVRAPPPAHSVHADVAVRVRAQDRVVSSYAVADPRMAETETGRRLVLPTARAFVYVPIRADLSELEIVPLRAGPLEGRGRLVVRLPQLLREVCKTRADLGDCAPLRH